MVIQIFWSNVSSICPKDSMIQPKLNKLLFILQLLKSRIFQKRL